MIIGVTLIVARHAQSGGVVFGDGGHIGVAMLAVEVVE